MVAVFPPPQAAQLCTVSAPFPRHQGTLTADTMALGFPWAGSGSCHQACQEIAADTGGTGRLEIMKSEFVKFQVGARQDWSRGDGCGSEGSAGRAGLAPPGLSPGGQRTLELVVSLAA